MTEQATSGPLSGAPDRPAAPRSLTLPMGKVLRLVGLGLLVVAPVLVVIAAVVSGWAGIWGVVLGLGIPVLFFGVTVGVALFTASSGPGTFGAVVLGTWLLKIVALGAVLVLVRDAQWWSRPMFFVAFVIGVVGWLAAEAASVVRSRLPYVDV